MPLPIIQPESKPPSTTRSHSKSPPTSPTTTVNSNTSRSTCNERPRGSFWDTPSEKSSSSSTQCSSQGKKTSYSSLDHQGEQHQSPGEQEAFWNRNDQASDADMPDLQSSSSEFSDNPESNTGNGPHTFIPSTDDFSFNDRALRNRLTHTLSAAHQHLDAFASAWLWACQQDCYNCYTTNRGYITSIHSPGRCNTSRKGVNTRSKKMSRNLNGIKWNQPSNESIC